MRDFLLDTNGDLQTPLVRSGSTNQHQALLLETTKGAWKENPKMGVGIIDFLESESPDLLVQEIRQQFTADGMKIKSLVVKNGKIEIDAAYS